MSYTYEDLKADAKKRSKKVYWEDPEKSREYHREWYLKNRDRILESARLRYRNKKLGLNKG